MVQRTQQKQMNVLFVILFVQNNHSICVYIVLLPITEVIHKLRRDCV